MFLFAPEILPPADSPTSIFSFVSSIIMLPDSLKTVPSKLKFGSPCNDPVLPVAVRRLPAVLLVIETDPVDPAPIGTV